ncbi:Flp family type IVb pilin [Bradyrhizobium sp. USDA 4508]
MSTERLDALINEAERLARLTREQIKLVVAETKAISPDATVSAEVAPPVDLEAILREEADLAAVAFMSDRLRQRRPMKLPAMSATVLPFVRDRRGVTSIEYSVLAAGIALAIVAIVSSVGGTLGNAFQNIAAYLG